MGNTPDKGVDVTEVLETLTTATGAEAAETKATVVDVKTTETGQSAVEASEIPKQKTVSIKELADAMGLKEVEKTLPNGRIIKTIQWLPSHLPELYKLVETEILKDGKLGKFDLAVIDGACPTWMLPTLSHACHPVNTAVKYPQGGKDAKLPVSGTLREGAGFGENLGFEVNSKGGCTVVQFSLAAPQIDLPKTIASLKAPEVEPGKPVFITGRGPIAIAASLAEAYAHCAPFVANFQPGPGYVVSISHDAKTPLGTKVDPCDFE